MEAQGYDREQVIKELEKQIRLTESVNSGWVHLTIEKAKKALELLKEQKQEKNVYTWICPECGSQIIIKAYKADKAIGMSFDCCPVCGKDVLYGKAD